MPELKDLVRKSPPKQKRTDPPWQGPDGVGDNGGITFSLLSRFLVCRERFRLLVMEGLKPADDFHHRLEYGQMWHTCEEAMAGEKRVSASLFAWKPALVKYTEKLLRRYPLKQEQVEHWYRVCEVQFPLYVRHWAKHKDTRARTPLLQEQVFDVPYQLPSGRCVRLRGKWDAVAKRGNGIWLQENKTKSEIDEVSIRRQLKFDLQTMLYLVSLQGIKSDLRSMLFLQEDRGRDASIQGINPYNVVRRPLSGGKGSISRHVATKGSKCPRCKGNLVGKDGSTCEKCGGSGRVGAKPAESLDSFYNRLSGIIAGSPDDFFMRWEVPITARDIQRFKEEFLNPCLEFLCCWWDWVTTESVQADVMARNCHWRHPFGVWNALDEGGSSELDNYLETGSESGLQRVDNLFPELEQ